VRPQILVAHDVRDDLVEHLVRSRVAGVPLVEAKQGPAPLVAGRHARELLDELDALQIHDRVDERRDEAGLAAEVIANQGRVLAGLRGDLLEGQGAKAVGGEDALGGLEDARRRRREVRRRVADR